MKNIFILGFGHGSGIKGNLYGYINKTGKIILEPLYYELSNFNEEGYAFGIKTINEYDYNEYETFSDYDKYDFCYMATGTIGIFQKIDKNGNVEEISRREYDANYNIEQSKKDENINLKKQVNRKIDIEDILLESIFPLILALLAILIIIKIIKKEEKSDSANNK